MVPPTAYTHHPEGTRLLPSLPRPASVGMQGDPVSFAVTHEGAEPMGADLVPGFEDRAAAGFHSGDRLVEAALDVQVDQRTGFPRRLVGAGGEAPANARVTV